MEDEQIEQPTSHSEDVQTTETPDTTGNAVDEVLAMFGVTREQEQAEPEEPQDQQDEELEPEEETPAIADEPKKLRVKVNKEEIEVDDDQIHELVQKGFGLDKERKRRTEAEQALQRAAKLAGFETADEYLANLDKIEQQAIQKKQDDFDLLKQQLREDAENAGIDPDYLDRYLDAHPLLQQAREVVERESKSQETQKQEAQQQQLLKGWEELFSQHPELVENAPAEGEKPVWLTAEMDALIEQGYKPVHAYQLTNRDKFLAAERKRTEQDVIKKQRLNKRSQVVTQASAELEPEVPQDLASAFAAFNLDPKAAKKYVKK